MNGIRSMDATAVRDLLPADHGMKVGHAPRAHDAPANGVRRLDEVADSVDLSSVKTLEMTQELLLTKVGEELSAKFEALGIDLEASVGVDYSPQATAKRIVDFATGFFGHFQKQHPEMSEAEQVEQFERTIRGAVGSGIAEAVDILKGLNVGSEVIAVAQDTESIVDDLFAAFFEDLRAKLAAEALPDPDGPSPGNPPP